MIFDDYDKGVILNFFERDFLVINNNTVSCTCNHDCNACALDRVCGTYEFNNSVIVYIKHDHPEYLI